MKKGGVHKQAKGNSPAKSNANKTVQKPSAPVNMAAAKGGLSDGNMKKGYQVLGKVPVKSSPMVSSNQTAKN